MKVRIVQVVGWLALVGGWILLGERVPFLAHLVMAFAYIPFCALLNAIPTGLVADVFFSIWARTIVAHMHRNVAEGRRFSMKGPFRPWTHCVLFVPMTFFLSHVKIAENDIGGWRFDFTFVVWAAVIFVAHGLFSSRRYGSLFLSPTGVRLLWDDGRSFDVPFDALGSADQILVRGTRPPYTVDRNEWREPVLRPEDIAELRVILETRMREADLLERRGGRT